MSKHNDSPNNWSELPNPEGLNDLVETVLAEAEIARHGPFDRDEAVIVNGPDTSCFLVHIYIPEDGYTADSPGTVGWHLWAAYNQGEWTESDPW